MKRAKPWFKVFPDDYLWGTTKAELKPDERSVWIDFLCVATYKEGIIDITFRKELASKFIIPLALLNRCIKKFEKFGKIEIFTQKKEKKTLAKIIKWEKYQHSYLTSQGKRNEKDKLNDATLYDKDTHRNQSIEERRGEEKRLEEIRREGEEKEEYSPITKNLLSILKSFPSYSFQEKEDGNMIDVFVTKYPDIDFERQIRRKIEYWKENPQALKARKVNPRMQLFNFFDEEVKSQE